MLNISLCLVTLIVVVFIVILNQSIANVEDNKHSVFSPEVKERLSKGCKKEFTDYVTHKEGQLQLLISKQNLLLDLNNHLPLTDLKQLPLLGDYEKCQIFSKWYNYKYVSLQIYLHQLDDYLKNVTNGESEQFKRFFQMWTINAVIGLCVPQQCTTEDTIVLHDGFRINQLDSSSSVVQKQFSKYSIIDVTYDEFDTPKLSYVMWIFVFFTSLVITINVLSLITKRISLKKDNFLGCFNLRIFLRRLLARNTIDPPKLLILGGVRSISTLWVLYAGIYETNLFFPNVDIFIPFRWIQTLAAGSVLMAPMVLYQFQTINGFTLGYNQPSFSTSLKSRIFGVILPMYPLILIYHTSLGDLGGGPMWFTTRRTIKTFCNKYIWTSYLLIQNYYNAEAMCPIHTWYMSVDVHFILFSPFLFCIMRKKFKFAVCLISFLMLTFCLMATYLAYVGNMEPTLQSWSPDFFQYIYFPSHMRSPVWLSSVLAGFAFKERKLNLITKYLDQYYKQGWYAAAFIVVYTTLFTVYSPAFHLPLLFKSLYIGFHTLIWSFMVLWIILVYLRSKSVSGGAKRVQWFLSLHIFTVLDRLSYGLYLTAPIVQMIVAGRRREAVVFSTSTNILGFFDELIYKLLLSVYWYLFIQLPIISLATFYLTFDSAKK